MVVLRVLSRPHFARLKGKGRLLTFRLTQFATNGNYYNTLNAKDGVILANFNYSPKDASPKARMPDLQKWSDVAWLMWEEACKTEKQDVGGLKYVFRLRVSNDNTKYIVSKALESTSVEAWPSTKFSNIPIQGKRYWGHPTVVVWLGS